MSWFDSDWLSNNLRTVVHSVILNMDQSAYDSSESKLLSNTFESIKDFQLHAHTALASVF